MSATVPRSYGNLICANDATCVRDLVSALSSLSKAIHDLAEYTPRAEQLGDTRRRLLFILADHPSGIYRSTAARIVGRSLPSVMEALAPLERRGLVARRFIVAKSRCLVELTDAGRSTVDRLRSWDRPLYSVVSNLAPSDLVPLTRTLQTLLCNIQALELQATHEVDCRMQPTAN